MRAKAGTRMSASAIPEDYDPQFDLPLDAELDKTTRHSIVSFVPSAKAADGCSGQLADVIGIGFRDSNFSDVSGLDVLNYWNVEDDESSRASTTGITPRAMMRHDPYQGVNIEVKADSVNNQGVVMYHVDINGPEGMLSTYTIRKRYRAFRNLYMELSRLIDEYAKRAQLKAPGSSSALNVPMSPASQQQQQTFTRVVLPPLPNAGVWSYLKRHDRKLVEQRKRRFQEILRIAIRHPATRSSSILDEFLSIAPSEISQRGSSYVSLQDYSVPVFDHQRESVERVERRQRKMKVLEGRRQRTNSEAADAR